MFAFFQNFLEHDFLMEDLSSEAPVSVIMEGSEPRFFTRFFTWDSVKSVASHLIYYLICLLKEFNLSPSNLNHEICGARMGPLLLQ